jgi:hypothetical protein
MCGDDEDTGIAFQAGTLDEARSLYVEDMWERELEDTSGTPEGLRYRGMQEANGEGVFVNAVYESNSPIKESI